MAASPMSLVSPARAFVPAGLLLLALALSIQIVMAASQQPAQEGAAAVRRSWPEGAELLAARELDLPAGVYQWRIARLTATQTQAASFEANPGFVVSILGAILVQTNEEETLRLTDGAGAVLFEDDRVVVNAEGSGANSGASSDAETEFLVVELVDVDQMQLADNGFLVGPLTVPAGGYTMVLVNLPAAITDEATIDAVMSDSLRPGVSIAHDDEGVPTQADPARQYDRWIVTLYPSGPGAPVAAPPAATGRSTPVSPSTSPAASPTVIPTATSSATPTVTPTATSTLTATVTPTATYTPTVSPTPTDTPTVTPTATPTDTPTVTPTATPTNTPTVTPTLAPTNMPTNIPT